MTIKEPIQSWVPVPDPTKLTTDAVALVKADLENLFDVKLSGFRELIDQKFAGVTTEFTMRDIALAAAFKAAEAAVKQQNESNALAAEKAASAFTKQIDSLDEKIADIKERVSDLTGRNWASVGGYIVGALGIAGLVATALLRH